MANKIRGEVSVKFNGDDELILRPTFEALAAVEDATGRGVIKIVQDIQNGDLRLKDLVEIISACGGMSRADAAKGVMLTGYVEYVTPIGRLLGGALGGNPKEGEKDPSPGTGSGS